MENNKPFAAYPASLVQQNFGETVEQHGFLLWDIEQGLVKEFDVPNDHSMRNIYILEGTDYDNLHIDFEATKYTSLKVIWCDLSSSINSANTTKIKKYFKDVHGITDIAFDRRPINKDVAIIESSDARLDNITDSNIQTDILSDYLRRQKYDEAFIRDVVAIDDAISERILLKQNPVKNIEWALLWLTIENFKSIGDKIEIAFENNNGVWQIVGGNGNGKSTILDAIMYLFYGKTLGTVTREKHGDNRFINNKRKLDFCEVTGRLLINGSYYQTSRKTEREWKRGGKELSKCSTTVNYHQVDEEGELIINETVDRKNETSKVIQETIGTLEDFLRTSMINADTLNELLALDHAKFVDAVLRDSGLDIYEKKLAEFKDWKKEKYGKSTRINIDMLATEATVNRLAQENLNAMSDQAVLVEELTEIENRLAKGSLYKDDLLKKLHVIDPAVLKTNPDIIRDTINGLLANKQVKLEEIQSLESEINSLKADFDQETYDALIKEKSDFNQWLYEQKSLIKSKEGEIIVTENKLHKIDSEIKISNQDFDNQVRQLQNDLKFVDKSIQLIKDEIAHLESSKTCPTCLREKDASTVEGILETIQKKQRDIITLDHQDRPNIDLTISMRQSQKEVKAAELEASKEPVKNAIQAIRDEIKLINDGITNRSLEIEEIGFKIAMIDADKREVDKRNRLVMESHNIPSLIEVIELKIEAQKNLLINYDNSQIMIRDNEKVEAQIARTNERIKELEALKIAGIRTIDDIVKGLIPKNERTIQELQFQMDEFRKQERRDLTLKVYEECIHRDGIPTMILSRSLEFINIELENLLDQVNFNVFLNADLEMKMAHAINPEAIINVIQASGMQRTFASLALRLVLRKLNNKSKSNIILMDEIFGKLDGEYAQTFVELLERAKSEIDILVVIEHGYADIINADHLIEVTSSEDGISIIDIKY